MSTELANIDKKKLGAIVASCPPAKRSAMSKALKAASQRIRDSKGSYSRAFEFSEAMVENWWYLGVELKRMEKHQGGWKSCGRDGDRKIKLSDLGINKSLSARCQRLSDMEKSELAEFMEDNYSEEKYWLPSLNGACSQSRLKATESMKKPKKDTDKPHPGIRRGDFREVLCDVSDVDAIITDPPYGTKYLDLWDDLGTFASEKLKPDGLLIAYSGQLNLPQVYASLSKHLVHWWTLAVVHQGGGNLTPLAEPKRKVINKWKPVLVFMKQGGAGFEEDFMDLVPSEKPDKHEHNWAQSLQESIWLVNQFTTKGCLVVDPMAGSGTVGHACDLAERKFVGAELLE